MIYRDVTLSIPVLRSSSVQSVRTVVTSMLPLANILPDVFSNRRVNSPSRRFSRCWSWRGCREQEQPSHTWSWTSWSWPSLTELCWAVVSVTDLLWVVTVQNQTKRLDVELELDGLQSFILFFTSAHTRLHNICRHETRVRMTGPETTGTETLFIKMLSVLRPAGGVPAVRTGRLISSCFGAVGCRLPASPRFSIRIRSSTFRSSWLSATCRPCRDTAVINIHEQKLTPAVTEAAFRP